ncbi:HTH_Tnp_Tc3_2 domain-containing protein [Trichonephila clavipes]|nr:HTH_Tnp_Tc3_2 domain-containing protein [Trichonephila clavipes]
MIFYVVELLDDWNVEVTSWKYPRNLELPRVSSQGFGNDSKRMEQTEHIIRLSRQLSSATDTTVSRQTVYRRLGHIGLYARGPFRCAPLTKNQCRLRFTWSREHVLWTPQEWSCLMFPTSPGLVCSLILAGHKYGERQVTVTTKRTPINDTITVVQDGSFGEELFLTPELTCMFRV